MIILNKWLFGTAQCLHFQNFAKWCDDKLKYRKERFGGNISIVLKNSENKFFTFCIGSFLLSTVQFCIASSSSVPPTFVAVAGEMATFPCNISIPLTDDAATLILWYREDLENPIYTLDIRKSALRKSRHFLSPEIEGRAYFDINVHPPLLKIFPVKKEEEGNYKCRVDLRRSRTFIHYIRLKILVPPKVVIFDHQGEAVMGVIGPYDEGASISFTCKAYDGDPFPSVVWWKDSEIIDETYSVLSSGVVQNELLLKDLKRTDLLVEITCHGSNTNLTKPRASSVLLDLNLPPISVKVMPRHRLISVKMVAQLTCEARGARPQAILTWWREGREVQGTTETILHDGNHTIGTYDFLPNPEDDGKLVTCQAAHPTLTSEPLFDTVRLNVSYTPQLHLTLGTSNQLSAIKEGSTVYFECNIKANPPVTRVEWLKDDRPLKRNALKGVLIANQTLILPNVSREYKGSFRCKATNYAGKGESDDVKLEIQYSPVCVHKALQSFSVIQGETVNITCDIASDPEPFSFQWTLNSTLKTTVDLKRRYPNTMSNLQYVPRYLGDYGIIMCWGKNHAGIQKSPCVFNIIPDGEVSKDMGILAPSTDEDYSENAENGSLTLFGISTNYALIVGIALALVTLILVILKSKRVPQAPPIKRTYREAEISEYDSPIKKESHVRFSDEVEKNPDIVPFPDELEVYATSFKMELRSAPTIISKSSEDVYYKMERSTYL